jgi:hypothetical protein
MQMITVFHFPAMLDHMVMGTDVGLLPEHSFTDLNHNNIHMYIFTVSVFPNEEGKQIISRILNI